TLRETGERAREVVRQLKALDDVDYTYTTAGAAGSSYKPVNEGSVYVKLKHGVGKSFSAVLREGRAAVLKVPGLTYGLFEAGPFGQKPIQISVRGTDLDEMDRISKELVGAMQQIRGLTDIETSLEKSKPELKLRLDRRRASDFGIGAASLSSTLRAAVTGEVVGVIEDENGDSHDVRVRLRSDQRRLGED